MERKAYDIVILGGGVIGLSIARELRKRGSEKILLLEKGDIGREASWAAAGILAPQVEANEDGNFFRLCYESNKMYSQFATDLFEETGIDIELDRRGTLYVGFDKTSDEEFERRFGWQSAAGLNVKQLDRKQVIDLEPSVSENVRSGLLFPDDGQVENRKLVEALATFAKSNNIEIQKGVEAHRIVIDRDRVEGVETLRGRVSAPIVVVATGAWTSLIKLGDSNLPLDIKPIRGQMISYQNAKANIRHVVYSPRGYVVPRGDGRLLAGATVEDVGFDRSTSNEALLSLKEIAAEIVPALSSEPVTDHWAGLRPFAMSGTPVIGPAADIEGLFIATGHFRNGILLAPITAERIADAIKTEKVTS